MNLHEKNTGDDIHVLRDIIHNTFGGLCILVVFVFIQLSSVRNTLACQCEEPPTVSASLDVSDAVFSAEVADIQDNKERRVTLRIFHTWKGEINKWVFITTGSGSGDCRIDFEVGERYLVYASGKTNALSTSTCTRTRVLDDATKDLNELFRLTAKPKDKIPEDTRQIMEVTVNHIPMVYSRGYKVDYLASGVLVEVERIEDNYAYLTYNDKSAYMNAASLRPTGKYLVRKDNAWITPVERARREYLSSGLIEYHNFWITPYSQNKWRTQVDYQEWLLKMEAENHSQPFQGVSLIFCPSAKRLFSYIESPLPGTKNE